MNQASLQDFTLIKQHTQQMGTEFGKGDNSIGFYYFVLDLLFDLQSDEITDAITDNIFQKKAGKESGHDRGIDAVLIEELDGGSKIHLFNFKYTEKFEKASAHYPSGEIDKVIGFIGSLLQKDEALESDVNPALFAKIKDIWAIYDQMNPELVVHFCANITEAFESKEKLRFERELSKFSFTSVYYHTLPALIERLTHKNKTPIDAKFRIIDKNFFEKSDGDIRALIANIDAREIIRIVSDDESLRMEPNLDDWKKLQTVSINEDAFDDNVRIYLKQKSKINKNIKTTALSDENHRFFYFNNGITITCSVFKYVKGNRSPVVDIKDIQIVNGQQTIHALREAFVDRDNAFESIDLLCRIYETKDKALSTRIAEFTNSQNPVRGRDIRAIDYAQIKLEKEFEVLGLFYERKKNQYRAKPRVSRVDSEKSGQVILAFYLDRPAEAKNKKSTIYSDYYERIFDDTITAEKVLLPLRLFEKVEARKNDKVVKYLLDTDMGVSRIENYQVIVYSSYHLLWLLKAVAEIKKIELRLGKLDEIFALYDECWGILERICAQESQLAVGGLFQPVAFFKTNKLVKAFEAMRSSGEIVIK
jgi:hypothetical protein